MIGQTRQSEAAAWMRITLWLAAAYNIAWGGVVVLWPSGLFELIGVEAPRYPQIWQCVGMMVAVYGIGYGIAATAPIKWWPLVLVGLLGKVLGPLGFVAAAMRGQMPWHFGWTILANDLIWWIPFGLILHRAWVDARQAHA